ncbi:MAG TPA: shikimate dehydrogenase [Gammaproteobacteria bacterium]|nr:shikimate dehydrogenase [Gammaproteobacteria bacterium]
MSAESSRPESAPTPLLLGLIGSGIQASRTPSMHEREARAHGLSCTYRLLDLDVLGHGAEFLPTLLRAAERAGFAGLNVTHPCKQSVIPQLTALDDDARAIGAVNTVVLRAGTRTGYNTDWSAFRASIQHGLPDAALRRVVQLGAGGAGAATAYAILALGAQRLEIVDTEPARAAALAQRLAVRFPGRVLAAEASRAALASADGLIHATPVGMAAHPGVALPAEWLHERLWVAEVVYFPLETQLLKAARARGCRTLDGAGMAVWQAVEAFRLFTGLAANPERMRRFFDEAGTR